MTGVERKLRIAEEEKRRYEEANPEKAEGTRKYRNLCKYLKKVVVSSVGCFWIHLLNVE